MCNCNLLWVLVPWGAKTKILTVLMRRLCLVTKISTWCFLSKQCGLTKQDVQEHLVPFLRKTYRDLQNKTCPVCLGYWWPEFHWAPSPLISPWILWDSIEFQVSPALYRSLRLHKIDQKWSVEARPATNRNSGCNQSFAYPLVEMQLIQKHRSLFRQGFYPFGASLANSCFQSLALSCFQSLALWGMAAKKKKRNLGTCGKRVPLGLSVVATVSLGVYTYIYYIYIYIYIYIYYIYIIYIYYIYILYIYIYSFASCGCRVTYTLHPMLANGYRWASLVWDVLKRLIGAVLALLLITVLVNQGQGRCI